MSLKTACIVCLFIWQWWATLLVSAADVRLLPGKTDAISRSFLGPLKSDFLTPQKIGLQHEEITIPNSLGANLRLWLIKAENAEQTILFCMGNQGNISTHLAYAKILIESGFNVVMFDYQGFGGSTGTASALSLFNDTCRVVDYLLKDKHLSAKNIGSFGVSLGSPLAVAVAAKYRFGAVAVEDILLPAKKLDEIVQYLPDDFASKLAIGTVRNVLIPQVDPLVTARELQCPVLIMHGENDRLLPLSGSLELSQVIRSPVRVWLMAQAGHAPETLEIYDGEYAFQVQSFFQHAFASTLTQPRIAFSATQEKQQWQARINMQCPEGSEGGCYQICMANEKGLCHFVRHVISDQLEFVVSVPFEPRHVSAVKFKNCLIVGESRVADADRWSYSRTRRSQSLADFRRFETRFAESCPLQTRIAISFGSLRPVRYRNHEDLKWFESKLPVPVEVHSDVRPRYARLAARAFGELQAEDQETHAEFVERLLPFLPEDPNSYFQLENAGFQLQLRDEQLAGAITLLAKCRYDQGKLESARERLRTAFTITQQTWPTLQRIDALRPDDDFYKSIGSPFYGN